MLHDNILRQPTWQLALPRLQRRITLLLQPLQRCRLLQLQPLPSPAALAAAPTAARRCCACPLLLQTHQLAQHLLHRLILTQDRRHWQLQAQV
jgi:hypothetical protein